MRLIQIQEINLGVKIYYLSKDQYIKPNSGKPLDYTMDYLGSDYDYNNGGTKIVYFPHCMLLKLKVMDLI